MRQQNKFMVQKKKIYENTVNKEQNNKRYICKRILLDIG